jgi:hypothetical protein
VFGIDPLQSYYSAKGIAGNIIPASKWFPFFLVCIVFMVLVYFVVHVLLI